MYKLFTALALASASLVASARPGLPPVESAASGAASFGPSQRRELARIATRLASLQALDTCIRATTDRDGMRRCQDVARATIGPGH